MSDEHIELNFGGLKKIFGKNKWSSFFSVLTVFFLLISLIVQLDIASSTLRGFGLFNLFFLFPASIWFFLTVMLGLSTFAAYYEKYNLMFIPILVWLLFASGFTRTQNFSGLKDVSTGDWTLAPDLDPFLYLRHAKEIASGGIENPDLFRSAPLGTENYASKNMMPWAIFFVYKIMSSVSDSSITYAAIVSPVIFSLLASVFFFFFVRTLFTFKFSSKKSTLAAVIATTFYVFNASMLHRTTGGVPEIESLGMVWFWLAFLFFIWAWKQENVRKRIIYGACSGFFTGLMSFTWGGYRYIFLIFGLAAFISFLFQAERRRNVIIFSSWAIVALLIEIIKNKNVFQTVTRLNEVGFVTFILVIVLVDILVNKESIRKVLRLGRLRLPRSMRSIIAALILALIFLLIVNPSFIKTAFLEIIERLLYPFGRSRVGLTVAENRAPYFREVFREFGYLFWAFFVGTVMLFYEAIKDFSKKLRLRLSFLFILFVTTFIFSRISPTSVLNGENFISKILYLGGLLLFGAYLLYIQIKSHRDKDGKTISDFRNIKFSYILILSFSFWVIVSMRGAVRLFFIIAPLVMILTSYFIIRISEYTLRSKDSASKFFLWIVLIISLLLISSTFVAHTSSTVQAAKASVPSAYEQQWQKAMSWVRGNTMEGSIFAHWWDYGYWVQTIGERPTLTDGGHPSFWFTYASARYLLTTSDPYSAMSMAKSLNISYLLIDSSDLGKYGAFSKIGSNEEWDRFSVIQPMVLDPKQTQERTNSTLRIYQGTSGVDEDLTYMNNGEEIFIPGPTFDETGSQSYKSFVIGAAIDSFVNGGEISFSQPEIVIAYGSKQYRVPIRKIYYNKKLLDFGKGVDATIMIIPGMFQNSQGGFQVENLGSVIYLSPRTQDTLFAQLYLMDDPNEQYPGFSLVHTEDDIVVESLKGQGINQGEFVYYQGFRGPIKIWDSRFVPSYIQNREEFLDREKYSNIGNGEVPFAPLDDVKFKV